jgi:hypothetical protein
MISHKDLAARIEKGLSPDFQGVVGIELIRDTRRNPVTAEVEKLTETIIVDASARPVVINQNLAPEISLIMEFKVFEGILSGEDTTAALASGAITYSRDTDSTLRFLSALRR